MITEKGLEQQLNKEYTKLEKIKKNIRKLEDKLLNKILERRES